MNINSMDTFHEMIGDTIDMIGTLKVYMVVTCSCFFCVVTFDGLISVIRYFLMNVQ